MTSAINVPRVSPLARAAAASAVLSAIAAFVPDPPPKEAPVSHAPVVPVTLRPVCGERAIPEGDVCLPLPAKNAPLAPAEAARTRASAQDDTTSAFLPRRPDRPAELSAYQWPVAGEPHALPNSSGSRPPGEREGIDLSAALGDKVMLAPLEGAEDTAKVVFVGEDVGVTVVTLHTLHDGGATRLCLMIYGHLDRPGPGVVPGSRVHPGDVIGLAGDSGSKGVEQLYLEARLVREGALARLLPDDTAIAKARLSDDALSIATDVRNVLAKKPE